LWGLALESEWLVLMKRTDTVKTYLRSNVG